MDSVNAILATITPVMMTIIPIMPVVAIGIIVDRLVAGTEESVPGQDAFGAGIGIVTLALVARGGLGRSAGGVKRPQCDQAGKNKLLHIAIPTIATIAIVLAEH